MPTLAQANVEITARTGKYKASIADVKRRTEGFGKSATKSLRNVTLGLTAMGAAATVAAVAIGVKLTQAIVRAGRESIKTAVRYDKLERGLVAVAGSSEEAERQLTRLQKVAELPGLSFEQAIRGSINLQAAGLEASLAERALKAFGNALVTVGKGSEDLAGVNLALTQIANKTSGFGQDVRQLQERLPQMQVALKNAFDGKPLEDLEITGKELVAALVAEFEKLPKAAGGIANSIENIGISFDLLKRAIGETMLSATKDVIDGMDSITKELTFVVQNFNIFRGDIAKTFKDIALIGFRTWSAMLQSMVKLTVEVSRFIGTPLKAAWRATGLAMEDSLGKSIIRMFAFSEEREKRWIENRERRTKEHMETITDELDKDLTPAFDELTKVVEAELSAALEAALSGLGDVDKRLKQMTDPARQAAQAWAAIREGILGTLQAFGLVREEVKKGGGLGGALFDQKEADAALKAIGNFNARSEALRIKDAEKTRQAQNKLADILRAEAVELFEFQEGLQQNRIKKQAEAMEQMRQQAQDAAGAIRPAFENLFAGLISGNTKSLWAQFWDDLKRIAISRLASIFAGQLLGGIFGGGGGIGGLLAGGSLLAGLGPIAPAAIGAAGVIGPLLGRAGGFLEGNQGGSNNTFIFNETDFANMDRNRLQKTVSQTIAPALAEDAVDGR